MGTTHHTSVGMSGSVCTRCPQPLCQYPPLRGAGGGGSFRLSLARQWSFSASAYVGQHASVHISIRLLSLCVFICVAYGVIPERLRVCAHEKDERADSFVQQTAQTFFLSFRDMHPFFGLVGVASSLLSPSSSCGPVFCVCASLAFLPSCLGRFVRTKIGR